MLPGLTVGYWFSESLSKIASRIGWALHINHFTASIERISYARVYIDVDASEPLIDSVEMVNPTGIFYQPIAYD